MVSKLATFRTDDETWDSFQAKAKRNGTNASALLQRFVRDYLDDKLDSCIDSPAAPNVDIESIVNAAIESRLETVLNQVRDLELKVHSQETYSLLYTSLKADVDIRFDENKKVIAALTSKVIAPTIFTQATPESEGSSAPDVAEVSLEPEPLPIIEAIATIAAPSIKKSLDSEVFNEVIATTAKPKSTKRSAKSKAKYTRDELEKLKNTDIRKIYRAEIPVADRALDPNYASKADMIDAILTAKKHT